MRRLGQAEPAPVLALAWALEAERAVVELAVVELAVPAQAQGEAAAALVALVALVAPVAPVAVAAENPGLTQGRIANEQEHHQGNPSSAN